MDSLFLKNLNIYFQKYDFMIYFPNKFETPIIKNKI